MSRELLADLLSAKVAFQLRTLELILGLPAQGMSAGTAETQSGSGRKPASPVAESDAS